MRHRIRPSTPTVGQGGGPTSPTDVPPTARAVDTISVDDLLTVKPRYPDSLGVDDNFKRLTARYYEDFQIDELSRWNVTSRPVDSLSVDEARLQTRWGPVTDSLSVDESRLVANPRYPDSLGVDDFFAPPTITIRPIDSLAARESQLKFQVTMVAAKDTWVDYTPSCVGAGGNNNGTDLQCDPLVAVQKISWFAFDMSKLPSNLTLTSDPVTATVYQKTASAVAGNIFIRAPNPATFSWSETTAVCSNTTGAQAGGTAYIDSGLAQSAGTDRVFTLNSQAVTQLGADITNARFFNVVMSLDALSTGAATFQSKDSGGSPGNTSGPRLSFTATLNSVT